MTSLRNGGLDKQLAAEKAVAAIGLGYDVCRDVRLSGCKDRVVDLPNNRSKALVFPGGVTVPDVSASIKCHPGESFRDFSQVLSFHQMSEQFNLALSLSGKVPSGLFNAMFDMRGSWKKDAGSTKTLAFDGWFLTLYSVELDRAHLTLSEHVKNQVPTSWNPAALAEFIEKYGTHVVVGVKMGGKDVVHMKQFKSSHLQPTEVQRLLKKEADKRFSEDRDACSGSDQAGISVTFKDDGDEPWKVDVALAAAVRPIVKSHSTKEDLISISVRRGGVVGIHQHHKEWLSTISQSPEAISMLFVPITSLLSSSLGHGFLSHAMSLYLRYKPHIDELRQFLEFQLPRQWSPLYDDVLHGFRPRCQKNKAPSLQFTLFGSKLYVNTIKVDSGYCPVTGIRLFLEGRKSDHLAIHLQHLSNLPQILKISYDMGCESNEEPVDKAYFEPVKWKRFSHVCTAPVLYNSSLDDEPPAIVTKAWLEVKHVKRRKVLFLRLGFSLVESAEIYRSEWDGSPFPFRKSGFFSALMSTMLTKELHHVIENEKPTEDSIKPIVYNGESGTEAPVPIKAPEMLSFVDTKEKVRGPEDTPGYWVVTGAKLCIEGGKISIKARYSLLAIMSGDFVTT
ncbi:MACPF domain-containing protein NSL1 isoform X1 [Neltuma alba]|uniref:MACPF domain-containing protein NSL1 isoform X1 n=1 Tax=Neltuma alba TaxID=207710 RepID=UPI0010A5247B|nr:MACPF domain-containing protein NSL1-like isoform X1 [Prosopis alba]